MATAATVYQNTNATVRDVTRGRTGRLTLTVINVGNDDRGSSTVH